MKQCVKCGKSGIFLKLDDRGLCKDCADAVAAAAAAEKRAKINEAIKFINAFGERVKAALSVSVFMPSMEEKQVQRIIQECDFVKAHIDDWKNYEYFQDAFDETLQKDSTGGISPLYPGHKVFTVMDGYVEKLFNEIFSKAEKTRQKAIAASYNVGMYSRTFKVVGVTFKNGRRSRQTILREIYFEDPPYKGNFEISLKKQDFEGEDAVAVYAIDEQVGFISKEDLPWLLEHWTEYREVSEFAVYGGGSKSYGMEIQVTFKKRST